MLKDAMVERLSSFVMSLDDYLDILQGRSSSSVPTQNSPAKAESSTTRKATCLLYCSITNKLLEDCYLESNLEQKNRPSLVAVLNAVAQNLFGLSSRA